MSAEIVNRRLGSNLSARLRTALRRAPKTNPTCSTLVIAAIWKPEILSAAAMLGSAAVDANQTARVKT